MSRFIKIPVTEQMVADLKECEEMANNGEDKDCSECSLNGGDVFNCMAEQKWCKEAVEQQC